MNTAVLAASRGRNITLWVMRILMAALFLFAALSKLSAQPMMVAEFQQIGFGQWFRYFTAASEITGAVALLMPRFSIYGAIGLLAVDIGAFIAQVTVLHMDWIHTIVIGLILSSLVYLQRASLGSAHAGLR